MDYDRFLRCLPAVYEDWGQPSVRPRSPRFAQVLHHVRGMTSPNVLQLLHAAVASLEPGEVYCEVGSFQGATLIGALLDNAPHAALAADNFCEFDPHGHNAQALHANLRRFGVADRVAFFAESFEAFFARLRSRPPRIGVYLYDAAHDYRSQLLGLLLVRPFLAERALLFVDDTNERAVQQANRDFLALEPASRLLLDLPTPGNGHPTFWNGLQLLAWHRAEKAPSDFSLGKSRVGI